MTDDINNNEFDSESSEITESSYVGVPELVFKKLYTPGHLLDGQDYFWFYKQFFKGIKPFRKGEEIDPVLVDCLFEDCKVLDRKHFYINFKTGEWTDLLAPYPQTLTTIDKEGQPRAANTGNIVDFYFVVTGMSNAYFLEDDFNKTPYAAFLQVQDILKGINIAKPLTDVGNAERFVEQWNDTVCYLPHRKQFMVFDGGRYALDDSGKITGLTIKTVKHIYDEGMDEPD